MNLFFKYFYWVTALLFLVVGCASQRPTTYKRTEGNGYGLKIKDLDDGFKISIFMGNSQTSPKWAYHFSRMGAIEDCEQSDSMAYIMRTVDSSKKIQSTGVARQWYPQTGFIGYQGLVYPMMLSNSMMYRYPVTMRYPNYGSLYHCTKRYNVAKGTPRLKALTRELVSPMTKDFRGGLLVDKLVEDKEEKPGQLKPGDAIISVEGQRVEKAVEYLKAFTFKKFEKAFVKFKIIRNSQIKTIQVGVVDLSGQLKYGNDSEVSQGCLIFNQHSTSIFGGKVVEVPLCSQLPKEQ